MWGNVKGWIIAAVLALILGIAGWWVTGVNKPTSPTKWGMSPTTLARIELPIKPATIVPMSGGGDAGDLYRKAVKEVQSNRRQYEDFLAQGTLADARKLAAIKYVMDAKSMSSMKLLTQKPDQNVGYPEMGTPDDLAAIKLAGLAVQRVGLFQNAEKQHKEAIKSFEASFALGAKLFEERLIFMEAFEGLGLMNGAAEMMKVIAKSQNDPKRAADLDAFLTANRTVYEERLKPVWTVISSVGGTPKSNREMAYHAGDIYYFTTPAMQERMWRVESTLKLGRFKYHVGGRNYGRVADQTIADSRLTALQSDPDPCVSAAAKAAQTLTRDEYFRLK